jgi:hypothetical protein
MRGGSRGPPRVTRAFLSLEDTCSNLTESAARNPVVLTSPYSYGQFCHTDSYLLNPSVCAAYHPIDTLWKSTSPATILPALLTDSDIRYHVSGWGYHASDRHYSTDNRQCPQRTPLRRNWSPPDLTARDRYQPAVTVRSTSRQPGVLHTNEQQSTYTISTAGSGFEFVGTLDQEACRRGASRVSLSLWL